MRFVPDQWFSRHSYCPNGTRRSSGGACSNPSGGAPFEIEDPLHSRLVPARLSTFGVGISFGVQSLSDGVGTEPSPSQGQHLRRICGDKRARMPQLLTTRL
jgi:hypothetical protein